TASPPQAAVDRTRPARHRTTCLIVWGQALPMPEGAGAQLLAMIGLWPSTSVPACASGARANASAPGTTPPVSFRHWQLRAGLPAGDDLVHAGERAPDPSLLLDHLLARAANFGVEAGDGVLDVVAGKPAIVGFAQGGVDAHVGRDAREHER